MLVALRAERDGFNRRLLIEGIVASGGIDSLGPVDALEATASMLASADWRERLMNAELSLGAEPIPFAVSTGLFLRRWGVPEHLASRVIARADALAPNRPDVSSALLSIAHSWQRSTVVDRDIVRRIATGEAGPVSIERVLARRGSLAESVRTELGELAFQGGVPGAIAVVLLGDEAAVRRVLASNETASRRALLACARLVREPLDLEDVAGFLSGDDDTLAFAAERYLESEDSAAARRHVLALYPGQARILGARGAHDPGHGSYGMFAELEEELRESVLPNDGPTEIIAMLTAGWWGDAGQVIIRRWDDRTELAYRDRDGTLYRRDIAEAHWDKLVSFLRDHGVDELPPLTSSGVVDGLQFEYVRLTKDGGRRVFMNNPDPPSVYATLAKHFFSLVEEFKNEP